MVSPVDVEAIFDAMQSAKVCHELGLIDDDYYNESMIALKSMGRKYMGAIVGAKIRADDVD